MQERVYGRVEERADTHTQNHSESDHTVDILVLSVAVTLLTSHHTVVALQSK